LFVGVFVLTLVLPRLRAETFFGKCDGSVNGNSQGSRDCKIVTTSDPRQGNFDNCPQKVVITVYYNIGNSTTMQAPVDIEGGNFSGSCTNEWGTYDGSGSIGGGNISGSITITYSKGNTAGTTRSITFEGATR
jgi:hypothetical protein